MWLDKYEVLHKEEGIDSVPMDYFTKAFSDKEMAEVKADFDKYLKGHGKTPNTLEVTIPSNLILPAEYIDLLKYSNGGTIVSGAQEFGFFGFESIRAYYICYMFWHYAPNMLPIALNGGGTFYAYYFSENIPTICGVHASCIGDADHTAFLGNTLEEVLSNEQDIDDTIYEDEVKRGIIKGEQTEEEKQRTSLHIRLSELKDDKAAGKVTLKEFLKVKKEIESALKSLE